jgi:micrococcal nuclease
VLGLALLILVIARLLVGPPPPSPVQPPAEGSYAVRRVVDGDTIVIEPDAIIRLIGVDTPETVKPDHPVEPWGAEATEFTREFLSDGVARLSFDRERVDRYGRFLAYVWVGDRMLNEELLRNGMARYEPQFNYSGAVKNRFRRAQQDAQQHRVGIWSNKENEGKQ